MSLNLLAVSRASKYPSESFTVIKVTFSIEYFNALNITFIEQGEDLTVTFTCKDGSQKCGEWIVEFSEFLSTKVAGSKKMGNDYIFDYTNYKKQTIRLYLDALHGLPIESLELVDGLELMRFLCYEGKTSKIYSCFKLI